MVLPKWHIDMGKKPTGGVVRQHRKKKKYMLGSDPILVKISEKEKRKVVRVRGGNVKVKSEAVSFANVFDPKTKKTRKVRIIEVVKNPANPHYVRRNIITKGCIIRTEIGNAKVTSRPSQEGVVNAVLLA